MAAEPSLQPLKREFFARESEVVARDLLGVWLLRRTSDGLAGGPIVEVEAYAGPEDKASHTRAGRTARTEPMFGEVGHAYVYLVYGMHNCLNVVAYKSNVAGAVLIRAIAPRLGVELMRARRARPQDADATLAAGPARLCQALAITRDQNSVDLTAATDLWLAAGEPVSDAEVSTGPRIGVDYAGPGWVDRPWRFWLSASPSVSGSR